MSPFGSNFGASAKIPTTMEPPTPDRIIFARKARHLFPFHSFIFQMKGVESIFLIMETELCGQKLQLIQTHFLWGTLSYRTLWNI